MLDYEILSYKVTYSLKNGCVQEHGFSTEDAAIAFVTDNRNSWSAYKLIKLSVAIIDF